MKRFILLFSICYFLFSAAGVFAASNSFTVGLDVTGSPPPGGGGGDTTPPTASSLTPPNGATGVSATTTLAITFSELVNKVSGNVTVRRYADDVAVDTIAVAGSQVTVAGAVATIALTSALAGQTQYYVDVAAGTFVDQSSNSFAGVSGKTTWSFTTLDTTAPTISAVSTLTGTTIATTTFTTSESALATYSWGTTTDYALGSASEVLYGTVHAFTVSGLSPATTYYFRIVARDASGNQSAYPGSFTTGTPPPPPDTTPPANPSGFTATGGLTSVALSWADPSDPDFASTRVMRGATTYPADPSDGVLVYQGTAESTNDTGLTEGTTYYYAAFARDTAGNYSSGAIAHATTGVTPPPPGVEPPPPPPPPGGGDGTPPPPPPPATTTPATTTPPVVLPPSLATSTGPFLDFPATGTPAAGIRALVLADFMFTELGETERRLTVESGNIVRVDARYAVRAEIAESKLPKVLKTIAFAVADAKDSNKVSTIILRLDEVRGTYAGVLAELGAAGTYPFVFTIMDHQNQGLFRIPGAFIAALPQKEATIIPEAVTQIVTNTVEAIKEPVRTVAPVVAPVGVAVGAAQTVALATSVSSWYDLYLVFLKLIGLLTGIFRRKRKEPWGVVYDSITKRPLDPAYVIAQIRGTGKSKGEAITDLDGRYGFVLDPGEYVILANKTHYKFPSEKLKGRARDEFYENLYFGDPFAVNEGAVVQYNIPLDPVAFDWNEFAKNQDRVFKVYSKRERLRLIAFNAIFFFGFAFSIATLALSPSGVNATVVAVYAAIVGFQMFWRATHRLARVFRAGTKKPLAFALVKIWVPGVETVARKVITDEQGRFYALVAPGEYYVTVEEKLPDETYKEVLRTKEMKLKKGVIEGDLEV